MNYPRKGDRGLTLVETLILILVVALVVVMAYPALKKIISSKEQATASQQSAP
jgi:Tfp pilus assembly protein FimT